MRIPITDIAENTLTVLVSSFLEMSNAASPVITKAIMTRKDRKLKRSKKTNGINKKGRYRTGVSLLVFPLTNKARKQMRMGIHFKRLD